MDAVTVAWVDGPITVPCIDGCGGTMRGEGAIATGETLPSGYTPAEGEIVSIRWIECESCHTWQVS